MDKICGCCKFFVGGGDWNLCCEKPHSAVEFPFGFLCYETSPACEMFEKMEMTAEIFRHRFCSRCGSQRCAGPHDDVFFGDCRYNDFLQKEEDHD